MARLRGKVAVITGAARGMGRAHALRFAREGAKVAMTDILREEGEAAAREIGQDVRFFHHDVTSAASWTSVLADVEAQFGPINVLVNNAGIGYSVALDETEEDEYRRFFEINQLSVYLGMKLVAPSMRRAGGGSIINISSTCGFSALPGTVGASLARR